MSNFKNILHLWTVLLIIALVFLMQSVVYAMDLSDKSYLRVPLLTKYPNLSVIKCIVVDLDNLLWGGEISELGASGILLSDNGIGVSYKATQEALLRFKKRGGLLAIASRNRPEDVDPVWKHPHILLKKDDFVAVEINPGAKSESIQRISERLGLNPDQFAFLDDNALERSEVKARFPGLCTPDLLKSPEHYAGIIDGLTSPDGQITQVSSRRTELAMIQQNRNSQLGGSVTTETLRSLETKVVIIRNDSSPESIRRIAEITQRTNQFNLTAKRYSEKDVEKLLNDPDYLILTLASGDRFGFDDVVCLIILHKINNSIWEIDTLCKSCRVLLVPLEEIILAQAVNNLKDKKVETLKGSYIPTAKNQGVSDLLERLGFINGNLDITQHTPSLPPWIDRESVILARPGENIEALFRQTENAALSSEKREHIVKEWLGRIEQGSLIGLSFDFKPASLIEAINRNSPDDKDFANSLDLVTVFVREVRALIDKGHFSGPEVTNAVNNVLPRLAASIGKHPVIFQETLKFATFITKEHKLICCPFFSMAIPQLAELAEYDEEKFKLGLRAFNNPYVYAAIFELFYPKERNAERKKEGLLPIEPSEEFAYLSAIALSAAQNPEDLYRNMNTLAYLVIRLRTQQFSEWDVIRYLYKRRDWFSGNSQRLEKIARLETIMPEISKNLKPYGYMAEPMAQLVSLYSIDEDDFIQWLDTNIESTPEIIEDYLKGLVKDELILEEWHNRNALIKVQLAVHTCDEKSKNRSREVRDWLKKHFGNNDEYEKWARILIGRLERDALKSCIIEQDRLSFELDYKNYVISTKKGRRPIVTQKTTEPTEESLRVETDYIRAVCKPSWGTLNEGSHDDTWTALRYETSYSPAQYDILKKERDRRYRYSKSISSLSAFELRVLNHFMILNGSFFYNGYGVGNDEYEVGIKGSYKAAVRLGKEGRGYFRLHGQGFVLELTQDMIAIWNVERWESRPTFPGSRPDNTVKLDKGNKSEFMYVTKVDIDNNILYVAFSNEVIKALKEQGFNLDKFKSNSSYHSNCWQIISYLKKPALNKPTLEELEYLRRQITPPLDSYIKRLASLMQSMELPDRLSRIGI